MNTDWTFDGRIPEELTMNVELEIRKLTESYCIENNIPIRRKFTHAELEESIEQVREAAELLKADSFRAIRQVNAGREAK
jgi:translation elongation factor EF-Tu-like GTPase